MALTGLEIRHINAYTITVLHIKVIPSRKMIEIWPPNLEDACSNPIPQSDKVLV